MRRLLWLAVCIGGLLGCSPFSDSQYADSLSYEKVEEQEMDQGIKQFYLDQLGEEGPHIYYNGKGEVYYFLLTGGIREESEASCALS